MVVGDAKVIRNGWGHLKDAKKRMNIRQRLIEEVCQEYGSWNIKGDDELFWQICRMLLRHGALLYWDFDPDDINRYNQIEERKKNHNYVPA